MHAKPNIIFLPGWGFRARAFEKIASKLTGHPVQFAELNENVIITQESIIIAWSLGGLFATSLCSQFSSLCKKLILVSHTPKFAASADWAGASNKTIQQFTTYAHTKPSMLLEIFSNAAFHPDKPDISYRLNDHHRSDLVSHLDILFKTDNRQALHNLTLPIMHILGEKDKVLPANTSKQLNTHYPHHAINTIKSAGHASFLTHEKEFTQLLLTFIEN